MSIYLSNTPEDADLLMSALLAEDRGNLLDSIMQSIHLQYPILYQKTNLEELANQMSIEPADLSCIYNARSEYLRCAIAPSRHTCKGCLGYKSIIKIT